MKRQTVASMARRRRITGGVVATLAVLAVAHEPMDFTSAQADAHLPASVSGALPVATVGSGPGERHSAVDPGCQEDQAAVVAPSDGTEGLRWVCVTLDDGWADLELLDAELAE